MKVAHSAALQVLNPKMPMGKARRGKVGGRPWCNWMNRMLDNLHLLLLGLVSWYLGHGHENPLLLLLLSGPFHFEAIPNMTWYHQ